MIQIDFPARYPKGEGEGYNNKTPASNHKLHHTRGTLHT
jgi:hypothetical protein